jgi:hypothetical protein
MAANRPQEFNQARRLIIPHPGQEAGNMANSKLMRLHGQLSPKRCKPTKFQRGDIVLTPYGKRVLP